MSEPVGWPLREAGAFAVERQTVAQVGRTERTTLAAVRPKPRQQIGTKWDKPS
jgi:hypothetical protein